MLLTNEEIDHLASLSRLELSPGEREETRLSLGRIIEYFEKIEEPELKGVRGMYHVFDSSNVFRDDEPFGFEEIDEIKKRSPGLAEGFFSVPGGTLG